MELIDKAALVAEINRRIEEITLTISLGDKKIQKSGGNRRAELVRFLSFIDTLEVKEVQEEPVSNDLEEFALQYAGHHAPYDSCMQEVEDAVKAGAEWQKEQMMKDAVDGLVVCDELTHGYNDIAMHIPDNLEVGNKVKLIIIKED